MRSVGIAVTMVVSAASSAHAEEPIVVNAGVGVNVPIESPTLSCYSDHASKYRPVFNLDVAYRFLDQFAAGVHVGARHYPWEDCGGNIPGAYQMYRGLDTALELGVVGQWSMSRFWAAAWVGAQSVNAGFGGRHLAYALDGGLDLYVDPARHRVGVYLDLTRAEGGYGEELHLSAGVAYRYW